MTFVPRWSSTCNVTVITDMFLSCPGLPIGTKLPNVERVPLGREIKTYIKTQFLNTVFIVIIVGIQLLNLYSPIQSEQGACYANGMARCYL